MDFIIPQDARLPTAVKMSIVRRFPFVLLTILHNACIGIRGYSLICVDWTSDGICVGGEDSLTSTDVVLTYGDSGDEYYQLLQKTMEATKYRLQNCSHDCIFFFEQREHGGGECNCVDIYFNSDCSLNATTAAET